MNRIDLTAAVFVLVCIAFCIVGFSRIESNTEDVLQWLPDQSEAREKYDLFESKFGSDDFLIVTWDQCTVDDPRLNAFQTHVLEHDTESLIQRITTGTDVVRRLSADLRLKRSSILARLRGVYFGTRNPEATCALVELSSSGTASRADSMRLIWDAIDADPEIARKDVVMGGYPYIATFIDGQLKNSFRYFLVPSIILATALALICLRDAVLTLIVFLTAIGAAATSIAFIPICNMKFGGLMSIIPALVFVLATSGALHLIRYSLDTIGDPGKLLRVGWRPCLVSAATTSIGMLSLLRSDFPAIRNFGLYCATGVGFALAFQLILVPCLLARIGVPGLKRLADRSEDATFWVWLMNVVQRRKVPVACLSLGLLVMGAIGLSRLYAEVEVEKLFRPNSEILTSIGNLESRLAPMDQTELLVVFNDPDPERFPDRAMMVRRIQSQIARLADVDVIYSLVNFLPVEPAKSTAKRFFQRSAYRAVLRRERTNLANGGMLHIDEQSETWRVSLRFPFTKKRDFGKLKQEVIAASQTVVDQMEQDHREVERERIELSGGPESSGVSSAQVDGQAAAQAQPKLVYTGKTHLFHHAQLTLLADLFQNFLLAFLIITPILMFVLRSFFLGLIAMIPNVFPTLLVFGGLGWMGVPVDLAIAMTACVALGIAVDDTTHFLIRFRDFGGSTNEITEPVMKTIVQCGPAMLQTTLIGSAGLFVYYFSDMLVVSRFAWAIATLLVIALLADVLMLPAILFLGVKSPVRSGQEGAAISTVEDVSNVETSE